jgi:hypothetical protein
MLDSIASCRGETPSQFDVRKGTCLAPAVAGCVINDVGGCLAVDVDFGIAQCTVIDEPRRANVCHSVETQCFGRYGSDAESSCEGVATGLDRIQFDATPAGTNTSSTTDCSIALDSATGAATCTTSASTGSPLGNVDATHRDKVRCLMV